MLNAGKTMLIMALHSKSHKLFSQSDFCDSLSGSGIKATEITKDKTEMI